MPSDYFTDEVCQTLSNLDNKKAIRTIHRAYMQLRALTENVDCTFYNNIPALEALSECLEQAGHPGYPACPIEKFTPEDEQP